MKGRIRVLILGFAIVGCGRGAIDANDAGQGGGTTGVGGIAGGGGTTGVGGIAGGGGTTGVGGIAGAGGTTGAGGATDGGGTTDVGGTTGAGGASGSAGGGKTGTTDGGPCAALTSYTPTTTAAISFAKDIYPILTDMGSIPATTSGCAAASICHGTVPQQLNAKGVAQYLKFTDPPATVLTALMASSVNAPSMKQVVAGNVAQSFFAYKISGAVGLACANAACVNGASVGFVHPCGDVMPVDAVGTLTGAQRTRILDWIAQGAAN